MKLKKRVQTSFGQFITRKARSYTPLQRVLVALAGVLIAGFFATLIAVGVMVASGSLVSDPSTAFERDMIQAQKNYRAASQKARQQGMDTMDYAPAVQAKARIILLQIKKPSVQENARKAADELIDSGTLDPLALYACAKAYETDKTRTTEARLLLAKAAHNVGAQAGSLSRVIYSSYAQLLTEQAQLKQACIYLKKAAEIAPASPALYVKLGSTYEQQAEWYDAAVAYLMALKYDPQNQAAQKAYDNLAQRQPDRAKAAQDEVK